MSLWLPTQIVSVCLLATCLVFVTDRLGITDIHPVLINTTHSLPLGIYIRTWRTARVGSVVAIPLPHVMREYISLYPAWLAFFDRRPLLKPVVALAGDEICRDATTGDFSARGKVLGKALAVGPDRRPLPHWQGCQRLVDGQIAVFSNLLPDSLDSRFYGPVPAATAHEYRMVWKW